MQSLSHTDCYVFHGLRVAISTDHPAVSKALQSRLRQFRKDEQATPDLTLEVHSIPDGGSHRVAAPLGLGRAVYDPPVGEVVYFDDSDQLYINYGNQARVLCDLAQGRARVSMVQSAESLWLVSHPLFIIPFVELLKRQCRYSIHAAGLSVGGRGLLLAGASGSGKSTLAIALLRAGFGFLGDDTLFLASGQDGVRALAFPDEIDVTEETVGFFPELARRMHSAKAPGWPKRPVWAEEIYEADFVRECRPSVLVFPRVANKTKSVFRPMDLDEALLELVPNVLLTEGRSSQAHLDVLAELARQTTCYRLETGNDFDAIPLLLQDLLCK
jgi:hypothetical protein